MVPDMETNDFEPPALIADELPEVPPPHEHQPLYLVANPHAVDTELAEAILGDVYDDYRFVTALDNWIVRDGERWRKAGHGAIESLVSAYASATPTPDGMPDDPDLGRADYREGARQLAENPECIRATRVDRHARYAAEMNAYRRLQSGAGKNAIAREMTRACRADTDTGPVIPEVWADSEPTWLWAGSIAFDLAASANGPKVARTEWGSQVPTTEPHMLSARYVPDASVPTPMWDELTTAIWPDAACREHALNVLAHGFHGYPTSFAILGRSATGRGKTLIAALMSDLLGDYAGAVEAKTLFGNNGSAAFAFREMGDARFVVTNEGTAANLKSTESFKAVVNPDPFVSERGRMQENTEQRPAHHTLFVTINPQADLDYSDAALLRRVVPVRFDGDPREIERLAGLYGTNSASGLAAWQSEAPGVMAEMMRRAAYVLGGMTHRGTRHDAPAMVLEEFAAVTADADPFAAWLEERTFNSGTATPTAELYADYAGYCRTRGAEPVPVRPVFGKRLSAAGVKPQKVDKNTRGWAATLRGLDRPQTRRNPGRPLTWGFCLCALYAACSTPRRTLARFSARRMVR
jgi:hypothetical protein